jgi:hypothetical protein
MQPSLPTGIKRSFFHNDYALVCSLLVFYGLCFVGLFGSTFWWVWQSRQTMSANATATGMVAVAHSTELAGYELIDTFNSNINQWRMGAEDGDYWKGSTQIASGVYIWDVREVQDGFVAWSDFPGNDYIKDYDTYVDTKIDEVPSDGDACSGLLYRLSTQGWDTGAYSFLVCSLGYYEIYYHNADGWEEMISQYHPVIRSHDWNRLEVSVQGSQFMFWINNELIYQMVDEHQTQGGVALMIKADTAGTKILFDNFGYQSRLENSVSPNITATLSAVMPQSATATFEAAPLSQLQATSTAIARATTLASYEVIDTFDSNTNDWVTGPRIGFESDETSWITSGEYLWQIDETYVDHAMLSAEFYPMNDYIKNYDVYVDTKFVEAPTQSTCSGLMFRQSPLSWGGYFYVICHSGHFGIYYQNKTQDWEEIAFQPYDSIQPFDWNRLEVLVHDSHFTFLINNQVVYELEDSRQPVGGVALMMQVERAGTKIAFDNFGYQSR